MPTYRYRCQGCGEEFDTWQSIKDDALRTHDAGCGGTLAKVFSPAGIVLKGSGFYRNDSRGAGRDGPSREKDQESKNGDAPAESSKESSDRPSKDSKDSKASDTKSSDTKSSDTKSSDTKSSDTKSGSPSGAGAKPS